MAKKFKSPETEARHREHQFGQPNGNPRRAGDPRKMVEQREFYRWCESKATEDELREYVQNKANPAARRKFVAALIKCETIQDFFDLTNQVHGRPKEVVELQNIPKVSMQVFGLD